MNQQILADGAVDGDVYDLANITPDQGHILSYDLNGTPIPTKSPRQSDLMAPRVPR